jgi:hypothetical protein
MDGLEEAISALAGDLVDGVDEEDAPLALGRFAGAARKTPSLREGLTRPGRHGSPVRIATPAYRRQETGKAAKETGACLSPADT